MKHIFSISHLEIVPDYYLLEAEVEYFHAHSLLTRSGGDVAADLREQLEEALSTLRKELRARGLERRHRVPDAASSLGVVENCE